MSSPPVFALLAGESSGDNLGASLIANLKQQLPDSQFIGVGGPNMVSEGLEAWAGLDELSVNGFIDPIKRLPSLLKLLLSTRDKIVAANPVCFIGVDFNFFNLLLEGMLKKRGIKTVHYVSPTVWAWRKGRIKSIAKKVDLMLTLYPFELDIYQQNNIKAVFVGHPKADEIGLDEGASGKLAAREQLGFENTDKVIALLPGSRKSEVAMSGEDFIGAAVELMRFDRSIKFVVPAANARRKQQIEELVIGQRANLSVKVILQNSKLAMQAADVVLVNSGTATLEAMLLKKPMVMSYRLGPITYGIVSRLVSTQYFALPNILSQRALVPELIQAAATPLALAEEVQRLIGRDHTDLIAQYDEIHQILRKNAGAEAAGAIMKLVGLDRVSS